MTGMMSFPIPDTAIDGASSYAASPAGDMGGFDATAFDALAALEPTSFWFRSRNALIAWAARRYFPHARSLHEIGCGTGYVLSALREVYPHAELSGSELFAEGLVHARRRLADVRFVQMDARDMPFRDAFDVVGAFDVLEHIDDDDRVLREVHAALHAHGGLLLTVPQHRWLWSVQDVAAHHQRRYERPSLVTQLERAGFRVVRATSFVSLLLPGMLLQRRLMDRGEAAGGVEAVRVPMVLDRLLRPFMATERALIRVGVDIPVGGSLLVVAVREP